MGERVIRQLYKAPTFRISCIRYFFSDLSTSTEKLQAYTTLPPDFVVVHFVNYSLKTPSPFSPERSRIVRGLNDLALNEKRLLNGKQTITEFSFKRIAN